MPRLAIGKLDPSQVEQFKKRGYTVLRRAFGGEAVAQFDAWATDLVHQPEVSGHQWVYRDPSLLDPSQRIITRIRFSNPIR